jgi:DEAD/DEAH box helicase domain-containing protein
MTPDVLHAWLMSHLDDKVIAAFRTNLKLLVLDETHAYDGSFGTNMAFLLRRFRAVTAPHRLICSTATVGEAGEFIRELTGREAIIIGQEMDGARAAEKEILMARKPEGDAFEATAKVLRLLAQQFTGRFIAFADSRKAVEMMTVASMRQDGQQQDLEAEEAPHISLSNNIGILPFRAGYESVDREEIQKALANGGLRGVVATSALEVGLDIGDIDLVLLLDTPSSMKSFWQRIGRAGRSHKGFAVILDTRGFIEAGDAGLEKYLARPIEPNRLYLLNRYAQYTNALCAAAEVSQLSGDCDQSHFESLPESFRNLLENELNPITDIPADLYQFKQAAQSGPHYEFPLRNSMEKQFELVIRDGIKIGSVSFSNVLR